ncbi:MAG TPA: ligase-associated DNA damage response endonuclease PdeM [Alphaproteobacteria bacterium]|nr:ligase-associated DNA damage response endonuclease PdeM [Alphaproteobacteria bacterium]
MAATVTLNGAELTLDPSGAVWWAERSTLAVADLHLEKGSAFARQGRLLPPYDTRATIARLAVVLRRYRPARVVALGDSFHDQEALARMDAADLALLQRLVAEHDWVWIAGNHDPAPPRGLGGTVRAELALEPLVFRHEPEEGHVDGEVCGHFHPKAAVCARGRRISGRCFVTDGGRLVLPAFGSYTGGLDALDPAISELFEGQVRVYLIGRDAIYLFAAERLEGMRRSEPAASVR